MTSERTVNLVVLALMVIGVIAVAAATVLLVNGRPAESMVGLATACATGLAALLARTESDRRENPPAPVVETTTTTHKVDTGEDGKK